MTEEPIVVIGVVSTTMVVKGDVAGAEVSVVEGRDGVIVVKTV